MSDTIEFLDAGPAEADEPSTRPDDVARSRPPLLAVAVIAAATAALGAAVLVPSDTEPPPEPTPTTMPATTTTEIADDAPADDDRPPGLVSTVDLGPPAIEWTEVVWDVRTDRFAWAGDGFVGADLETEWTIRAGAAGPVVSQRPSPLEPGLRVAESSGAWVLHDDVLAPSEIVVIDDAGRSTFPVPADIGAGNDLVRPIIDLRALVDPDRVVLFVEVTPWFDRSRIAERFGIDEDVQFVDVGPDGSVFVGWASGSVLLEPDDPVLDRSDREVLDGIGPRRTEVWSIDRSTGASTLVTESRSVVAADRIGDELTFVSVDIGLSLWQSPVGADSTWMSGRISAQAFESFAVPSGVFAWTEAGVEELSTGHVVRLPFRDTIDMSVAGGVIAATGLREPLGGGVLPTSRVRDGDTVLEIDPSDGGLTVVDPSDAVVFDGSPDDPAVARTFSSLRVLDPAADRALVVVPSAELSRGFFRAATAQVPLMIAEHRIDRGDDVVTGERDVWAVRSALELFGDGSPDAPPIVSVRIAAGPERFLAAVTDANGDLRLYLGSPLS